MVMSAVVVVVVSVAVVGVTMLAIVVVVIVVLVFVLVEVGRINTVLGEPPFFDHLPEPHWMCPASHVWHTSFCVLGCLFVFFSFFGFVLNTEKWNSAHIPD